MIENDGETRLTWHNPGAFYPWHDTRLDQPAPNHVVIPGITDKRDWGWTAIFAVGAVCLLIDVIAYVFMWRF